MFKNINFNHRENTLFLADKSHVALNLAMGPSKQKTRNNYSKNTQTCSFVHGPNWTRQILVGNHTVLYINICSKSCPRLIVFGLEASLEGVDDGLLIVDLTQQVVLEFSQTFKDIFLTKHLNTFTRESKIELSGWILIFFRYEMNKSIKSSNAFSTFWQLFALSKMNLLSLGPITLNLRN